MCISFVLKRNKEKYTKTGDGKIRNSKYETVKGDRKIRNPKYETGKGDRKIKIGNTRFEARIKRRKEGLEFELRLIDKINL